jgi:hypothetical protein
MNQTVVKVVSGFVLGGLLLSVPANLSDSWYDYLSPPTSITAECKDAAKYENTGYFEEEKILSKAQVKELSIDYTTKITYEKIKYVKRQNKKFKNYKITYKKLREMVEGFYNHNAKIPPYLELLDKMLPDINIEKELNALNRERYPFFDRYVDTLHRMVKEKGITSAEEITDDLYLSAYVNSSTYEQRMDCLRKRKALHEKVERKSKKLSFLGGFANFISGGKVRKKIKLGLDFYGAMLNYEAKYLQKVYQPQKH